MSEATYWNGEPTPCTKVRVLVGKSSRPTWWCAAYAGTERDAVRVEYVTGTFYLDNEDGGAWLKVTEGLGSPRWRHRDVPVEREVEVAV